MGNWIKIGVISFIGLVAVCGVIGAILNATGFVSRADKTQTALANPIAANTGGSQNSASATPVSTSAPPTSAPPPTEIPATPSPAFGQAFTVGQWEVVVDSVATDDDLGDADGAWVVVRGSIKNRGEKRQIGQEELKLRYDDIVLKLKRSASKAAAERYGVPNIGQLGGETIALDQTIEFAIAFDVSKSAKAMVLEVDDEPVFALGELTNLDAVPTAVPVPTRTPSPTDEPRPTDEPEPTDTPRPDVSSREGAISVCVQTIKKQLTYPSTADFPTFDYVTNQIDDKTWKVVSTVEAQNGFGVELTYQWSCVAEYEGNDLWNIKEAYLFEQ